MTQSISDKPIKTIRSTCNNRLSEDGGSYFYSCKEDCVLSNILDNQDQHLHYNLTGSCRTVVLPSVLAFTKRTNFIFTQW